VCGASGIYFRLMILCLPFRAASFSLIHFCRLPEIAFKLSVVFRFHRRKWRSRCMATLADFCGSDAFCSEWPLPCKG